MVRGRPRKQGSLHEMIRIDGYLKEILYSERQGRERYSDTIFRIIREKAQLQQENYRLNHGQRNVNISKNNGLEDTETLPTLPQEVSDPSLSEEEKAELRAK